MNTSKLSAADDAKSQKTAAAPKGKRCQTSGNANVSASEDGSLDLRHFLRALTAAREGNFSVRLPTDMKGVEGRIAGVFNDMMLSNQRMADELERMSRVAVREGKTSKRADFGSPGGAWTEMEASVNNIVSDLVWTVAEITRSIDAVSKGDLTQRMSLEVEGRPLEGEFLRSAKVVNTMIGQLNLFTSEVTRVAREVGVEGRLGGQANVPGAFGTWRDSTDNVNLLAANLTTQVRAIADVERKNQEIDQARRAVEEKASELARQTQIIKSQAADLTAHNQRQGQQLEVIQKLNEELKDANAELEAFSYTVSHDLRAPLRSLTGYVNVLMEDYGNCLDEKGRGHLQALYRAAKRMDCLTRDLLAYGRVAREAIQLEPVRLQTVIEEIVSHPHSNADSPPHITIEAGQSEVLAHRFLLEQSIGNLLSNATKFVRPGTTPKVCIRAEARSDRVRLWVEDNGIGIDPGYHHKIFNIFERVGEMQKYEGTGIGLAIVHRAVQRMGGNCGVISATGEGSRFWIDFQTVGPSSDPAGTAD